MFITEQYINHKAVTSSGKRDFRTGMPLTNRRTVKRKFTYKELTLVLGVFVAMIVAITLWSQTGDNDHSKNSFIPTAERVVPVINSLVKSVSTSSPAFAKPTAGKPALLLQEKGAIRFR